MWKKITTATVFGVLANSETLYVDQNQQDWYLQPLSSMMHNRGLKFNQKAFSNHGCWCATAKKHAGQAMSELDSICHQLTQCMKCVEMQENCGVESYYWMMDVSNGNNSTDQICPQESQPSISPCHKLKCECTDHTLSKIVEYLEENRRAETQVAVCENDTGNGGGGLNSPRISFSLNNEQPDIFLKSAWNNNNNGKPHVVNDACCGTHPSWFPYNTQSGERGCCKGKTFNKNTLQCCEKNGQIMGVGADCEAFDKPEKKVIFESSIFENKSDSKKSPKFKNLASKSEKDSVLPSNLNLIPSNLIPSNSLPSNSLPSHSRPSEYILPTCNESEHLQLALLENGRYGCAEKDECRSTRNCEFSLVPDCGVTTRLVSYKMDQCCSYYYCAPVLNTECGYVTCQDESNNKCGKYQQTTVSLNSFNDCCPEVDCVCDYNKCKYVKKPVCASDESLVVRSSDDGCCDEFGCVKTVQKVDGGRW